MPLRLALASALAALALGLFATNALAQLPSAQLTSAFPPGGKAGTTVEVTVAGADIDDLERLHFSHSGIAAEQKVSEPTDLMPAAPVPGQFKVTIAADVPPGSYEVRGMGRFGLSNPRTFVVGPLNEIVESGPNNSADQAIELPVGTIYNGRVEASNYDFFRLPLKQGERVLVDLAAQRIDSRLDGTLVLLDPAGNELTRVRRTGNNDPMLDFTPPADGNYTLKLHDLVYAGGPDHFYRLSINSAPFVDFIFPPSGPPGSEQQYTIYGRNLPGGQPAEGLELGGVPLQKLQVTILLPGDEPATTGLELAGYSPLVRAWQDGIEFRLPTPQGLANPVSVYFARSENVIVEQEPNNDPSSAQKVSLPCEVVGQFYPQRDVEWLEFEAKKGDVYWIECISSQLGLASDPYFALFRVNKNDQGQEQLSDVAQVDDPEGRNNSIGSSFDTTSDDPSYKFAVPEDGTYRLLVRDLFGDGRSDPSRVYRLAIRPPQPDFRLVAYPDRPLTPQQQNQQPLSSVDLRKGGTAAIGVIVRRRDEFDGEITVSVEGLPPGVTCAGAVIGGTVDSAALVLVAEESAATWAGPIKVIGKSTIGDREIIREARHAVVVWGSPNRQQQAATFRLTPQLHLGLIDKEIEPALVKIGDGQMQETSLGANVELPITLMRREEFKEAVKLVANGLPNQIKPKEVNVAGDQSEGKFELQLNQQNIKPGVYTFYMRGETKRNRPRNPDAIPAIEAEQKRITEMVAKLEEDLKTATAARDEANKAAQEAKAAAQQAEQKKTEAVTNAQAKADAAKQAAEKLAQALEASGKEADNQALAEAAKAAESTAGEAAQAQKTAADEQAAAEKALADAQAKAQSTEEARVAAEAALKTAQDKVAQANQLKQQIDQRVNQVKQENQPKDVPFALVSTPVKLKIHAAPFNLTANQPGAVKQGAKQELPVKIERRFGFGEEVELFFNPPEGIPGLAAQNVKLNKDQADGTLELTAADNAPPGEHICTVRCRARFNNVQVETAATVKVTVEAK